MTRVALDLLGGDAAPEQNVDGALLALDAAPDVELVLVGPVELAERLLDTRRPGWSDSGRLRLVAASEVVGMAEDPSRGVHAKRDATVRVAATLLHDGEVDALVSVGATGATLTAAVSVLHRLPGMSRPALACVVPAPHGPLVLLDAGATTSATVAGLCELAVAGAAFARVRLGLDRPRVGLLTIGEEPGKGDDLRKQAYDALAQLPLDFVGNVEGHDVPYGGRADVVVTDGFTGNVLLKGIEGATSMLGEVVSGTLAETLGGSPELLAAVRAAMAERSPERLGGAVLLGVRGVVVVGHGASTPQAVAGCVAVAVQAARDALVSAVADALAAHAEGAAS